LFFLFVKWFVIDLSYEYPINHHRGEERRNSHRREIILGEEYLQIFQWIEVVEISLIGYFVFLGNRNHLHLDHVQGLFLDELSGVESEHVFVLL
jgi:hypothetical protein